MPRDGNGVFNRTNGSFTGPNTWTQQANSGDKTINAGRHDTHDTDLADALTQSLSKDGQTVPTGNLPMGGNRHTNCGLAANQTDYLVVSQAQQSKPHACVVGGTGDAIELTPGFVPVTYAENQKFVFVAAAANTGPVTVKVSTLGAVALQKRGSLALEAGDIVAGELCVIYFAGTGFQLSTLSNQGLGNTGDQTITSTDPGTLPGPILILDRASASPAAGDRTGDVALRGRKTSGAGTNYVRLGSAIIDPADATAAGRFELVTLRDGSEALALYVARGLVVGSPTDGDKLEGSINAETVHEDGKRVVAQNGPAFESAGQTYAVTTNFTFAHGLSYRPSLYRAFLRCKTAQGGYIVGAEVPFDLLSGTEDTSAANLTSYDVVYTDNDTDIKVQTGILAAFLPTVTTGPVFRITPARWEILVRVYG